MQVISKNNHAQLSTIDEIKHAPASVELAPLAVTAFAEPLVPLRGHHVVSTVVPSVKARAVDVLLPVGVFLAADGIAERTESNSLRKPHLI